MDNKPNFRSIQELALEHPMPIRIIESEGGMDCHVVYIDLKRRQCVLSWPMGRLTITGTMAPFYAHYNEIHKNEETWN